MRRSTTEPSLQDDCEEDYLAGPLLARVSELDGQHAEPESVYPIAETHVIFAVHELLQHDFPHLRDAALLETHPELKKMGGAEQRSSIRKLLDEWLRVNSSFISESQAKQSLVNTPISTIPADVTGFRPHAYGRALVLSLEANERGLSQVGIDAGNGRHEGLLDIKGSGVAPSARPSFKNGISNGLLELGEALYEFFIHKLISKILRHAKSPDRPLPIYGILDLGFNIRTREGEEHRAGLIVRRAHRRPMPRKGIRAPGSPLVRRQFEMELLLRRYGVTSVHQTLGISDSGRGLLVRDPSRNTHLYKRDHKTDRIIAATGYHGGALSLDILNIQHTEESGRRVIQLLDFGSYEVRDRFENPLVSMVSSDFLDIGEMIHPTSLRFAQPRHRYHPLPTNHETKKLATAFLNKKLTGDEVRNKIDAEIQRIASQWG